MSREIKFRGFSSNMNKWVYGGIKFIESDAFIIHQQGIQLAFSNAVINKSVGQYTGLKDKNGKEIYEGDIIEHYALYGYVVFENGMFSMSSNANTQFCNCKQPMAYHDVNEMEIIGNIYENPELLKK